MARITLQGVEKSFGTQPVLKGIDLEIDEGEFIVFVGPSGCGKSTLLRVISGLETAGGGRILFGEEDVTQVPAHKRGVSMVFQSYALYPHMNVERNIGFGLRMNGEKRHTIADRVKSAAKMLGMEDLLARRPSELSGGQRQRVAIGRAIVRDPPVFLFDEPLSNLDAELRVRMRLEIAELHKTLRRTMIFVTHDQVEAMTLADRIVVMRDGAVEQIGRPKELYENPDNLFVAGFIGTPKMNFLEGRSDAETKTFVLPMLGLTGFDLPAAAPSEVTVGIRPEALSNGKGTPLQVAVGIVEDLGGLQYAHCRTEQGATLTVQLDHMRRVEFGDQLEVHVSTEDLFLFEKTGNRIR